MSALGRTANLSGPEETVHLCHSDVLCPLPSPRVFLPLLEGFLHLLISEELSLAFMADGVQG